MGNKDKGMNAVETIHRLDFEAAPWEPIPGFPAAKDFNRFRIGTCEGLWQSTENSYEILAITNSIPGNGHFEDVLQWFEHSCKRDRKHLKILEIMNMRFRKHLITKRGFRPVGMSDVIKKYQLMKT
jgi:hypothetical protein